METCIVFMSNKILHIILACFIVSIAYAQDWEWWPLGLTHDNLQGDTLYYGAEVLGLASSGSYAPFWLQSNRNGNISASPYSGNISVGIWKPATQQRRWYDYDFGIQLTGRVQSDIPNAFAPYKKRWTGYFNQLYAHVRLYFIDITAGIMPLTYETIDPLLSSGSMILSGNSQPMPRITIGIDKYIPFPGLFGYMELKGGITHAWMVDNVYIQGCHLHHKFAALRFGGSLPVNVSYEFHHAAQWGGISPIYGDVGSDFKSFLNVLLAQGGGTMSNDQLNAQGNHVGSQQLALTVKGKEWSVTAYWQNFFEDNFAFLGLGQNLPDGIWGVSIQQTTWPWIQGVTYEYMNTTDQSGPWHDRDGLCYGANDSYYRNSVFQQGWNYFYRSMGTPFITSPLYNQDGTIYTLNSRVRLHHLGVRGDICGFTYRILCSYVRNFGNNNTSKQLLSSNVATLLEINKHVDKAWGLDFGISLAGDFGNQFGNQFGAMLTIRKQGIITKW